MPPLVQGLRGHLRVRRSLWALALALVALIVSMTTGASASSASCSYFAASSGSDSNPGTAASPFQTGARLVSALSAGETGCLAAGQTFVGDLTFTRAGRSGAPITITSADTSNPATIRGRIVTKPGGDWITISYLKLVGVNADGLPSPTIGSDHVTLSHDDISNEHTAICINVIDSSTWGTGHYTTIDANRIHACGKLPAQNHDHGVYDSGYLTTITNNLIYDNADRGVQLRGDHGSVVKNNVIDGNGEGVIFGDLASSDVEVAYNIVTNSVVRSNVESYWGSTPVGTGNVFHDNCVYATNANSYYNSGGGVNTSAGGYSVQNVTVGDPAYVDRAAGDYRLRSTTKCAGLGIRADVTPGIAPSGDASAAPAPPAPAAPPAVTSAPTISGVAQSGQTLVANPGTWTGTEPLSRGFQWRRCDAAGAACTDVAGATTASYALTTVDVGSRVRVTVTSSNSAGTATSTSDATVIVSASAPPSPSPPVVAPSYRVTQSISNGATIWGAVTWTAAPSGTPVDRVDFRIDGVVKWQERSAPYQFNGDDSRFDSTTLSDGAHVLAVDAYSTDGAVAHASSTVTVRNTNAPASTAVPTVSGRLRAGRVLTASSGSWSGTAPIGYTYRWLRCDSAGTNCAAISGATATSYKLQSADVGRRLRARVTARNSAGNVTVQSSATSPITR